MTDIPTTPPGEPAPATPPAAPTPIFSILSLVGGIAGLVLACCWGAGFLFAVAGVVLGHIAKRKESPRGNGFSTTGLITGYIGAALSILIWILIAAVGFSPLLFSGMY